MSTTVWIDYSNNDNMNNIDNIYNDNNNSYNITAMKVNLLGVVLTAQVTLTSLLIITSR